MFYCTASCGLSTSILNEHDDEANMMMMMMMMMTTMLWFDSHSQSFASSLEQCVNQMCAQTNCVFFPQWYEK